MLPENLWGWYDGNTRVTLPSGRIITPPARTYLKYNPDAFAGRVVTTPNGRVVADHPGRVDLCTLLGSRRILDMLIGEQLPRIC